MERNKETALLLLLFALLQVDAIRTETCSEVQHDSLTCYNDYNSIITCVWNSTHVSDLAGTACKVNAQRNNAPKGRTGYSGFCVLEPFDVSRPALKKCSIDFDKDGTFQSFHCLTISLSCTPVATPYRPISHIKLNPPGTPKINSTTVSWDYKHAMFELYGTQLQWKPEDQSWSDSFEQTKETRCELSCEAELDPDRLIRGTRYEARVRVAGRKSDYPSTWSDWSPSASWVSSVGTTRPPDVTRSIFWRIIIGTAAFAVFLAIVLFRTDKTSWVYVVSKMRGPLLPDPGKSFLQDADVQTWLSPHFNSESFHSLLKPVKIFPVEVTCKVDSVVPCVREAAPQEKTTMTSRSESTSSGFFNPSYSHVSPLPLPPVASLSRGNLEPCAADASYSPIGAQRESKTTAHGREEEEGRESEILHKLSEGSSICETMEVISDYEKVEKLQVERLRLQSQDSGVCSGEEVSQESLEADSINASDDHDEPGSEEEEKSGDVRDVDFQKSSIHVCFNYERVEKLQADSAELPLLDAGSEEHVGPENVDTNTSFLFPPPLAASSCSPPWFTLPPLNPHVMERMALMATSLSVEPSGDGYMPVQQEQS